MPVFKKKAAPSHEDRIAAAQQLSANALGVFGRLVDDLEEASAVQLDVGEELQYEIDRLTDLQEQADLNAVDAQISADRIKSLFN